MAVTKNPSFSTNEVLFVAFPCHTMFSSSPRGIFIIPNTVSPRRRVVVFGSRILYISHITFGNHASIGEGFKHSRETIKNSEIWDYDEDVIIFCGPPF